MRTLRGLDYPRRRNGYSLLEVVVGVFLLFLATVYLLSMFCSGNRLQMRNTEYGVATQLCRNKLEKMMAAPAESLLKPGSGKCEAPYDNYCWSVDATSWGQEFVALTCQITSPGKSVATLRTLRPVMKFYGVTADAFAHWAAWSDAGLTGVSGVRRLGLFNDKLQKSQDSLDSSWRGSFKQEAGGLSGDPSRGFLWSAPYGGSSVYYLTFSQMKVKSFRTVSPPSSMYKSPPVFTALAGDRMANRLYVADIANKGVWVLNDKPKARMQWDKGSPWAPSKYPLGRISGMALDENASLLWLCDRDNSCLRTLVIEAASSGQKYNSSAQTEKQTGRGLWSGPLAPAFTGVGTLTGLALSPWSSCVYTCDAAYLYCARYQRSSSAAAANLKWQRLAWPEALRKDAPVDLAGDDYANVLFISTQSGHLWKYHCRSGSFSKLS